MPKSLPTRTQQSDGKVIVWRNGNPIPQYVEPVTPNNVSALISAALALPYEPVKIRREEVCERHRNWKADCASEEPCREWWEVDPYDLQYRDLPQLEVLIRRLATRGSRGDLDAIKELLDRFVGKPKQHIEQAIAVGTVQDWIQNLPSHVPPGLDVAPGTNPFMTNKSSLYSEKTAEEIIDAEIPRTIDDELEDLGI